MNFYTRLRSTAAKLIRSKGQLLRVYYGGVSGYGAGTSDAAGLPPVLLSGAVFDYPTKDVDGTKIQRGDKRLLLEAGDSIVPPGTKDRVEIGGTMHAVLDCKPVAPGGVDVVYEVQVRAGG